MQSAWRSANEKGTLLAGGARSSRYISVLCSNPRTLSLTLGLYVVHHAGDRIASAERVCNPKGSRKRTKKGAKKEPDSDTDSGP